MRADVHAPNPDPRSSVHKPSYPRERALNRPPIQMQAAPGATKLSCKLEPKGASAGAPRTGAHPSPHPHQCLRVHFPSTASPNAASDIVTKCTFSEV